MGMSTCPFVQLLGGGGERLYDWCVKGQEHLGLQKGAPRDIEMLIFRLSLSKQCWPNIFIAVLLSLVGFV